MRLGIELTGRARNLAHTSPLIGPGDVHMSANTQAVHFLNLHLLCNLCTKWIHLSVEEREHYGVEEPLCRTVQGAEDLEGKPSAVLSRNGWLLGRGRALARCVGTCLNPSCWGAKAGGTAVSLAWVT